MAKEVFKGDCRDAYLDNVDADLLLRGEGVRAAKDKQWDEHCDTKQLALRYSDCSEPTARTLSLMDWNKINYDLVEAVLSFIGE